MRRVWDRGDGLRAVGRLTEGLRTLVFTCYASGPSSSVTKLAEPFRPNLAAYI